MDIKQVTIHGSAKFNSNLRFNFMLIVKSL